MKRILLTIKIGNYVRHLGEWIMSAYWVCPHCGTIKYKEEEALCWECGVSEMVYKGDI